MVNTGSLYIQCLGYVFLMFICTTAAQAQPFEYISEVDNFQIRLPQTLYPVSLTYEQESMYGRVAVKNITFQSSLGKFVLQLVDYPVSDQRSPVNRMEAGIDQMSRNPDMQIEAVEDLSNGITSGIFIKSWNKDLRQFHAIFIDGQREYHISSESYAAENLEQVLNQSEALIRSFKLSTANALYYQVYKSRRVDALIAHEINPGYGQTVQEKLAITGEEQIVQCNQMRGKTPAELILMIDSNGFVENAFSSPRSAFGRCLELAYIGLIIEDPPISEMHLLIDEHLQ